MVENDALVTIVDVPEISESLQVSCVTNMGRRLKNVKVMVA